MTLQQAVKLVQEAGSLINLEVLFNVQDAIVPASGTFNVNLIKTASCNLGITINGKCSTEGNMYFTLFSYDLTF